MKLLFLSMHYRPEPCDTRTSQLASGLQAKGHETAALTSFPNYPFGRVYDGYRQRLVHRQVVDGVRVTRVPMMPDHSKSAIRRALSYLSFGFSASAIGFFAVRRPDLIWIHHPPLTTGIAGYLLAKIKRIPYVYEIHDLWPESLAATGMIREGRITRLIGTICDFLHRHAAAIVVTSPGMKDHLVDRGVSTARIHVFPQWAAGDEEPLPEADAEFGQEHGLAGKFNIVCLGNLGIAQGLDTVIEAAKRLRDLDGAQIVLAGAGAELERLRRRVLEESLTNVKFTGQVDRELARKYLAWADGLLVHLRNDPLFAITIPSRTQNYLAAGRPILCGVRGDTAAIVSSGDAGLCFASEDAAAMEAAIRRLHSMASGERARFGANARRAYEAWFAKDKLIAEYEGLFRRIVAGEAERFAVVAEEVARPARERAA